MPHVRSLLPLVACVLAFAAPASEVLGWDAIGHRTVTLMALDSLGEGTPSFLKDEQTRARIASQSCEPDRWRGTQSLWLTHINNPDHYIDLEQLADYSLSMDGLPRLRNDYIAEIAISREAAPEKYEPIDEKKDPSHSKFTPGFLPYSILENFAKVQASFKSLRIMEALKDPARAQQVEQERANVLYNMGVLSHFVADAAQPLHTTIHHHGWVGDNPSEFTRRYSFHAEIDGAVISTHGLNYPAMSHSRRAVEKIEPGAEFEAVKAYIEKSFAHVTPLYTLDKEGRLLKDEGKAFITDRLADAASMLAGLYDLAWRLSEPTEQDIANFVKFDKFGWETGNPASGR